jgi:hypothetical protein
LDVSIRHAGQAARLISVKAAVVVVVIDGGPVVVVVVTGGERVEIAVVIVITPSYEGAAEAIEIL